MSSGQTFDVPPGGFGGFEWDQYKWNDEHSPPDVDIVEYRREAFEEIRAARNTNSKWVEPPELEVQPTPETHTVAEHLAFIREIQKGDEELYYFKVADHLEAILEIQNAEADV